MRPEKSSMQFKPIKPKKISTQIAEQIRESILSGEFRPGDKLPPERELAEMFGVSRPSVREALNILAASGLVMSYQGGGTVVLSLVDMDKGNALSELIRKQQERALEVIEVRKCLESWTAYYAASMEEMMSCIGLKCGNGFVQGVTLDRFPSCLFDQADERFVTKGLLCFTTGHVGNTLFTHRAIHIICPKRKGHLGHFRANHYPVGLNVGEIIQHKPADGNIF